MLDIIDRLEKEGVIHIVKSGDIFECSMRSVSGTVRASGPSRTIAFLELMVERHKALDWRLSIH